MSIRVTWVVVAGRDRAGIFAVPRGMARLRRVRELKRSDEGTDHDAPGVYGFAAELARALEEARQEGRFDGLVLVALPDLLKSLRGALSKSARDMVVGEIGRDLVDAGHDRLQEEVLKVL